MRVLIGDIVQGRIEQGELLPREADLADQFGVSRGVARETIRGLEERGLVRVKHGKGAVVTPPSEWDSFDPEVLTVLVAGSAGAAALADFMECRQILEVEAAGLAAERGSNAHVEALAGAYENMRAAAERARGNAAAEPLYHEADVAFHRALVAATENQALGRITEPIQRALGAALRSLARPEYRFDRGLPEHERILEAVRNKEPDEARAAMRAHLSTVGSYLTDYAGGKQGGRKTPTRSRSGKRARKPRRVGARD
jgi:DNA-binding FadR family transcriptional regulator